MSTEVVVALIAAAGIVMAGVVGMATAYLTARHQARAQATKVESEFLADRDRLLWESAEKFWNQRAAALTNEVKLERTARESAVANVTAELALVKQDNAELARQNLECEKNLAGFELRLRKAGELLATAAEAAVEAADAATEAAKEATEVARE